MKFRVGMKVKLKTKEELLKVYPRYYRVPAGFNERMLDYLGKTVTIRRVEDYIRIEEDYGDGGVYHDGFAWHHTLFTKEHDVTDRVMDVLRGK